MDFEPETPPPAQPVAQVKKARGLHAPAFIGVAMLAAILGGGVVAKRSIDARTERVQTVQSAMDQKIAAWGNYHTRFEGVRWRAEKIRSWAATQTTEPVRSWARERARLYDAFAASLQRPAEEKKFAALRKKIEDLAAQGETEQAQDLVPQMPVAEFPKPDEVLALQQEKYLKPLIELSRQNPQLYKAFSQQEPEIAKEDIVELRKQLASARDAEAITPQQMFAIELLGAVVPEGDPAMADWSALASAGDYFENPDGATLAQWQQAQRAVRAEDWPNAIAHMQSILRTTIRTRQPFRAAYGWALLKNRPDETGEPYPFIQEAAAAGDATARRWVANEDLAKGRYAPAIRGLEAGVIDGDPTAVAPLLKLYAMSGEIAPRDDAREGGVLQKIIAGPDAPPEASLLLGQLHERGKGFPASGKKAVENYAQAARKGSVEAWTELARCNLRGVGAPADPEQAFDWASRAYAAGEREKSVPIIQELMQTAPDRISKGVQEMFERESVAGGGGYTEKRIEGPSIAQLKMTLGKYLDQKGRLGQAAHYYAQSGNRDPATAKRFAELTASHSCDTCGGSGKVTEIIPCPTCAGKGDLTCGHCDGHGKILVPGAPTCTMCDGRGTLFQDGRSVTCPTCEGSGKGKDSVTKKDCPFCVRGRIQCPACVLGKLKIQKECPDCHGKGTRALTDQGG